MEPLASFYFFCIAILCDIRVLHSYTEPQWKDTYVDASLWGCRNVPISHLCCVSQFAVQHRAKSLMAHAQMLPQYNIISGWFSCRRPHLEAISKWRLTFLVWARVLMLKMGFKRLLLLEWCLHNFCKWLLWRQPAMFHITGKRRRKKMPLLVDFFILSKATSSFYFTSGSKYFGSVLYNFTSCNLLYVTYTH